MNGHIGDGVRKAFYISIQAFQYFPLSILQCNKNVTGQIERKITPVALCHINRRRETGLGEQVRLGLVTPLEGNDVIRKNVCVVGKF